MSKQPKVSAPKFKPSEQTVVVPFDLVDQTVGVLFQLPARDSFGLLERWKPILAPFEGRRIEEE